MPLTEDDIFHKLLLSNKAVIGLESPIKNFFTFADGNAERMLNAITTLGLPWWTDPEIKTNFFRPLSAISHWLDHQLWPTSIFMAHLQNIILFFVFAFVLYKLFLNIYAQKKYAVFACLLFFFCLQLLLPVGWIAGRNALFTGILSTLILLVYYKAVMQQWSLGFFIVAILLGMALLFGEASLSITAFLFCVAVYIDPRPKITALLSLIPCALVSLLWLYFYQQAGYGAADSGFYISPFDKPSEYLLRIITGSPISFFTNLINFNPDPFTISDSYSIIFGILFTVLLIPFFVYLIKPVYKQDPLMKFWLTAFFLSLMPLFSVPVSGRTLVIPNIACIGILVSIFRFFIENKSLPVKKVQVALLNILLFMHFAFPVFIYAASTARHFFMPLHPISLSTLIDQHHIKAEDTLLVVSSKTMQTATGAALAILDNKHIPSTIIDVANPVTDFSITQIDELHYEIDGINNSLLYSTKDIHYFHILRDFTQKPITKDMQFSFEKFTISILEVDNNTPTKISVTLNPQATGNKVHWAYFDENSRLYHYINFSNTEKIKTIRFTNPNALTFL